MVFCCLHVSHPSVESTALRLITALGSSEVQPQFTRFLNDPKTVLSAESEELNRALILTLARATHVTGSTHSGFPYLALLSLVFVAVCVNLQFISFSSSNICLHMQIFSQGLTPSMGLGVKTSSRPLWTSRLITGPLTHCPASLLRYRWLHNMMAPTNSNK